MSNLPLRTLSLLLAASTVLVAAGGAHAQILGSTSQFGGFGTQVRSGDLDFIPLTKKADLALTVTQIDLALQGRSAGDCLVLDTSSTTGIQVDDLLLTSCMGYPAGTAVAVGSPLLSNADPKTKWASGSLHAIAVDVNENGKYDKGDAAYLGTSTGLVAAGDETTWTLRLLPFPTLPAAALVRTGDADLVGWSGKTLPLTLGYAQRDDKSAYLVQSPLAKGSIVPVNSIRVSTVPSLQPGLLALKVEQSSEGDILAGKAFSIVATLTNAGTGTGPGLVVTRINGAIADARLSPVMSPGESASLLIPLTAPAAGGPLVIKVDDAVFLANAKGGATASAASASDVAALQQQVKDLQARIVTLEGKPAVAAPVSAKPSAGASAPSVAGPALVALLAAVALVLRNRRA